MSTGPARAGRSRSQTVELAYASGLTPGRAAVGAGADAGAGVHLRGVVA